MTSWCRIVLPSLLHVSCSSSPNHHQSHVDITCYFTLKEKINNIFSSWEYMYVISAIKLLYYHPFGMIRRPHEIATVVVSYGRVIYASVWYIFNIISYGRVAKFKYVCNTSLLEKCSVPPTPPWRPDCNYWVLIIFLRPRVFQGHPFYSLKNIV